MITRRLPALALLPVLLAGCSGSDDPGSSTPSAPPASAPAPGVTLPPDARSNLVPAPEEVPTGMVLVTKGSGPRDLRTVAGYSGTGATATAAETKLTTHGFTGAYVAQYVNPGNGAILSVVAVTFKDTAGATADFADDVKAPSGTVLALEQVGDQSVATVTKNSGSVPTELLLLRFRKGATTWSLAYQNAPTADPSVATALAKKILSRA